MPKDIVSRGNPRLSDFVKFIKLKPAVACYIPRLHYITQYSGFMSAFEHCQFIFFARNCDVITRLSFSYHDDASVVLTAMFILSVDILVEFFSEVKKKGFHDKFGVTSNF